jgi:hypothetical protein
MRADVDDPESESLFTATTVRSALLQGSPHGSPFNGYSVQQERRTLAGVCRPNDTSAFRNLTYVFRGSQYPRHPITLHNVVTSSEANPERSGPSRWSVKTRY